MIAAAEKGGRLLSPVAQLRFKEAPWKIKRLLELGLAGRLHHVQTNAFYWRGGSYYDLDWRGRWETEGGGCTLNHAVHYIDLMLWWAGQPREVCAFMTNRRHENSEVEDLSTAILRYPDGMLGQVTSSILHHGEKQAILLQADRAAIALPFAVSCCRSLENGFPEPDPDLERTITTAYEGLPSPRYPGHTGQIENVLQAAEGKSPLLISGADGRGALELITAIYKSASLNTTVNLPLSPDDGFYTSEGIVKAAPRFFRKTRSVSGFSSNTITVGSADIR